MTRKVTSRLNAFRGIALVIAIIAVLIPTAAMAQTAVPRPRSEGSDPGAPLRGIGDAERPASHSQTKISGLGPVGPSTPIFSLPVTYNAGGHSYSVAVADVNGDGKLDLAVANDDEVSGDGSVGVLLGNGNGTFQPVVTYDSGAAFADFVVIADVNGDGKPDIVVANTGTDGGDGSVGVLLGNGDGTFRPAVTYDSAGQGADSVAVADVNLDGKPDLLVANGCFGISNCGSGLVGVLLGNGDGTFQPAVTYGYSPLIPKDVVVADLNGDGRPDMLVANLDGYSVEPKSVGVLLGNGDGTFQSEMFYSTDSSASSVVGADVNMDGKVDLLIANYFGGVGVMLGNGDGTFQPTTTYVSGGSETGGPVLAVGDVNGDNKPDLLVANYAGYCVPNCGGAVDVLLGNGDGTFQAVASYSSGGYGTQSVAMANLNGNSKPDVVTATGDTVTVLLNAEATKTIVLSSLNTSVFGQVVTFTAKVKSAAGTPPGIVTIFDGSSALDSATLVNGKASLPISSVGAGSHSITAAYQGGSGFAPSTSAPISQVVNIATTTTLLSSSQNPVPINEYITYTATVTSQYAGVAYGTVTFQDGNTVIQIVQLTGSSQASYSTKYTGVGTHPITATYSGDANNTGSTSSTLLEQVIKGFASTTVLTTSGSPSHVGQPVTFTATVTSNRGTIPDGELVSFYDSTRAIGSATTAGGITMFTTSALSVRTHHIKATYAGDAAFRPSTGKVIQVVEP